MNVTRHQLQNAAADGFLKPEQVAPLYDYLQTHQAGGPRFDFTHVLYYFGGMIAIGAMTLFMTLGWEQFGGWGIFFICLLYAGVGLWTTNRFAAATQFIPSGICAAFVVALTPLAIYGIQQGMGLWPEEGATYRDYHRYIKFLWIYMELGTLVVGAVMLWRYRYPFLLMPIGVTLWYMSMDVTELVAGDIVDFTERARISMWFGLAMTLLAMWVDIRSRRREDYAFWLYLFGVMAFWGGLSSQQTDNEVSRFLYFCINLILIAIGVVLARKVFVILGALGASMYFGHLANAVFQDSWLFPIALTFIGMTVIYLGVLWQKYENTINVRIRRLLPSTLREVLERRDSMG